jgi:hypothetical protein
VRVTEYTSLTEYNLQAIKKGIIFAEKKTTCRQKAQENQYTVPFHKAESTAPLAHSQSK